MFLAAGLAEDTIYITGLKESVKESDLISYFGQIGLIKVCRETFHNCCS